MQNPDFQMLAQRGATFYGTEEGLPLSFLEPEWANNYALAMDAQPALSTTPNTGIPSFLTLIVDPSIITVLFAPNKAAKIMGEVKKGDWTTQTAMFPMVEYTGEVSSYGDWSNNGKTGVNTQFPQRQAYLYQIIKEYGELEMARAGLARIAWAAEMDKASVMTLNKFQNFSYFFGIASIENYGLLNDPNLFAALTPSTKAAGGTTWFTAGGAPNATANEVYNDIVAMYEQLVAQANGLIDIDAEASMILAMAPTVAVALKFTNTFGITVKGMLEDSFANIKIETAVQYGKNTGTNQGVTGGNFMQLIATSVGGQDTGYCAFNEKLRTHRIILDLSSFRQKATQGTWGCIIRMPFAITSMLGV